MGNCDKWEYFRGTRGHCFSTTLGSALHELCHTFGLGHTQNGIMGRGFHNISDFFLLEPTKDWKSYKKCSYKSLVYKSDSAYWTSSSLVFLSYHRYNSKKWHNDLVLFYFISFIRMYVVIFWSMFCPQKCSNYMLVNEEI